MTHVLDSLTAWDVDGRPVRLGTLWTERAVVLLFVRHFGCLFCHEQVGEIHPHVERIRSRGAELVVIGSGSIDQARAFQVAHALQCPVLTDPLGGTFGALGMRRGIGTILRPAVLVRAFEAFRKGFRQSAVAGDPYQQGGVIVMARGGREVYRFISDSAGSHPKPGEIMTAVERAGDDGFGPTPSGGSPEG